MKVSDGNKYIAMSKVVLLPLLETSSACYPTLPDAI